MEVKSLVSGMYSNNTDSDRSYFRKLDEINGYNFSWLVSRKKKKKYLAVNQ